MPAPTRHGLAAARHRCALVILDLQQGKLLDGLPDRDEVIAAAVKLCRIATIVEVPILATEQHPHALGPTHPAIREAILNCQPISKMAFSAFAEEEFSKAVLGAGRPHLVVSGIMTHICVCQTVLDAIAAGYIVHVAIDAVSCWKQADHEAAIEKMRQAGAVLESAEGVVCEWLERAGTPEFKAALPYLKG